MLKEIKEQLKNSGAQAWVIYDFASSNPAYVSLFGKGFSTRKCFAVIDREDENLVICHTIDLVGVQKSPMISQFKVITYNTWQQLDGILENVLSKYDVVMMEISENGLLPRASYVDYGTVCSVKRFVKEVISSSDMFQYLAARFDGESLELHKKAARLIDCIKDEAFALISKTVRERGSVSEYEVQQFILRRFAQNDMVTDSVPIVAIGKNANSPHYEPSEKNHSLIRKGDLVLIDLWAKIDRPNAVFADVTWMGYVGETVPAEIQKAFDTVKTAIDKALAFLESELPRRKVCGYEVDDVCKNYLIEQGYEQYILHRTGHSMSVGDSDHGIGVNMDNFETHDTRSIMNGIAFSLEPGIYTPQFGLREEIDVYIQDNKPMVYTPRQKEIVLL